MIKNILIFTFLTVYEKNIYFNIIDYDITTVHVVTFYSPVKLLKQYEVLSSSNTKINCITNVLCILLSYITFTHSLV